MEGGGPKLAARAVEEEVGAFEDNGRAEREVVVPREASREVIEDRRTCNSGKPKLNLVMLLCTWATWLPQTWLCTCWV